MPLFGAAYAAPNIGTTILYWFRSPYLQCWVLQKIVEFKDFLRLLSDFPVLFKSDLIFKDFFRKPSKFKYFSSLCELWYRCLNFGPSLHVHTYFVWNKQGRLWLEHYLPFLQCIHVTCRLASTLVQHLALLQLFLQCLLCLICSLKQGRLWLEHCLPFLQCIHVTCRLASTLVQHLALLQLFLHFLLCLICLLANICIVVIWNLHNKHTVL